LLDGITDEVDLLTKALDHTVDHDNFDVVVTETVRRLSGHPGVQIPVPGLLTVATRYTTQIKPPLEPVLETIFEVEHRVSFPPPCSRETIPCNRR